jgi:hypothetical protein
MFLQDLSLLINRKKIILFIVPARLEGYPVKYLAPGELLLINYQKDH